MHDDDNRYYVCTCMCACICMGMYVIRWNEKSCLDILGIIYWYLPFTFFARLAPCFPTPKHTVLVLIDFIS